MFLFSTTAEAAEEAAETLDAKSKKENKYTNKNLLVKDTAKDLDKVARDRYTRYFVFQCKDPLLSSNIQLEVSPGRLRFTGKHQKYYDEWNKSQ